jgi:hypothetical protein
MERFDSLEERVEYGLDEVDPDTSVEVPLRDLLYVYKTLGQMVRFFQNPGHFPSLKAVSDFIGDGDDGALRILFESYYEKLGDVWPDDIQSALQDGMLDYPEADLDTGDDIDEDYDDYEDFGELEGIVDEDEEY